MMQRIKLTEVKRIGKRQQHSIIPLTTIYILIFLHIRNIQLYIKQFGILMVRKGKFTTYIYTHETTEKKNPANQNIAFCEAQ